VCFHCITLFSFCQDTFQSLLHISPKALLQAHF
jgi:hypothetical protein